MSDLKRMRLLCGLRQLDVWAGTGVPIYRISLAERGGLRDDIGTAGILDAVLLTPTPLTKAPSVGTARRAVELLAELQLAGDGRPS